MRRLNHIPGPPARPLVGCLPIYNRDRNAYVRTALRAHGDVCRLRFPVRDIVVVGHPDDAAACLNDTSGRFHKLGYRLPLRDLVGGLAFQEGVPFRDKRSTVASLFAGASLARAFERVTATVDARLDAEIAAGRDGEIVDLQALLSRLLLPGLLAALLTDRPTPTRVRTADAGVRLATSVFGFLRLTGAPPNLLRGPDRLPPTALVRLYRTLGADVRVRRTDRAGHDDVLAALLAMRSGDGVPMDDLAVTNELVLLLSASYGATVAALAHTFARVLAAPDAAAALYEESAALGPDDRSLDAVRGLRWARACFEEALRMQGSAPLVRVSAAESSARGFDIPAGTPLLFPMAVIHRDPRWWPDPDTYDPRRFHDPAPRGERPALAYLPFGSGPHRCLASQLAYALAQYVLATMIRRFRMELLPGWSLSEVPGLAPALKGGLPVRVTERLGAVRR